MMSVRSMLIEWTDRLPPGGLEEVKATLIERLPEAGPVLVDLIADERLWDPEGEGRGLVPCFCAGLAAELKYEPAVPALLKVLERRPDFDDLADQAVESLIALGEPAREGLHALCERHRAQVDQPPYQRALEVLVQLGPDGRTWEYLRHALQRSRELVHVYIAMAGDYGDQRAVYHLNEMLEERTDLALGARRDALEAIAALGGIPTARARELSAPAPGTDRNPFEGVGRNDPCPCGSGKKFKKCCLP